VIGRFFRRSRPDSAVTSWWRAADAAAVRPTTASLDELRQAADASVSPDEVEDRAEMIEGLQQLVALAGTAELPRIETQHRVIGTDTCHFLAPVSLPGAAGAPGKLFVTDRRLVVAGGTATTLAWHRIRRVMRQGREILVSGGDTALRVQCNSYGDALVVQHLTERLAPGASLEPTP
jgi:hypothetical protein